MGPQFRRNHFIHPMSIREQMQNIGPLVLPEVGILGLVDFQG